MNFPMRNGLAWLFWGALLVPLASGANGETAATMTAPLREVEFLLDMQDEVAAGRFDPARDRVGLRGARKPLAWDKTLEAVRVDGRGARYRVVVRFAPPAAGEQLLQYKARIDRAGHGPDDGWEEGRNRLLALDRPRQTVARKFNAPPDAVPLQRVGRIDGLQIAAGNANPGEARGVQVWLPPGYEHDLGRRYPVLYLHDGQTMFDADAAGAEWQMDEAADRLIRRGETVPFIMVAVDNTARRIDEYTPTRVRMPAARSGAGRAQDVGGGAAQYARYLLDDVKPEIDRRYRTLTGREHTSVGGASLAGLLSMWLALQHADAFGAALVVSPSAWWDDGYLVRAVKAAANDTVNRTRIWLDIGGNEGADAIPHLRQLRDALRARGWDDAHLRYVEDPAGGHDEASWALRAPAMLRFLYAAP